MILTLPLCRRSCSAWFPSVRLCLAYSLLNNYFFTHFIQPPANFAKAQQIKLIKKHKVLEQDQRQHNSLCVIFNAQYLL